MGATTEFEEHGCTVVENVLGRGEIQDIAEALAGLSLDRVGTRNVLRLSVVRAVVERLRGVRDIRELISRDAVAVQCTLFEKSATRNWLVAPHQDLCIPVRDRMDHPALGE